MKRTAITRFASLLAAVALAACDRDPKPQPPPAGAAVVVTSSPSAAVTAGVPFGATVEIRDASGNVVASSATVTLALAPGGTLLGTSSVAAVGGVATFSGLSVEAAGSYALVATSAGVSPHTSAPFEVVAAAPARLAFTASPGGGVAGEPLAPAAVVRVEDAFGNPVMSGLDTISIALQGGNPAAVLAGTTSAAAVLGEATFADLSVDLVGSYTLAASAAGLDGAASAGFPIAAAAASPANSGVAAAVATQTAGGVVAVAATVRDAFGNPVPDAAVTLATAAAGATLVQPPATDAAGEASGSVSSTVAGALTVTGSIGGGPAFAGTAPVTFEPGAPSLVASTLVATPASVQANGIASISLVATVKDEFGNAIPGLDVTLSSSGTATLVQPAAATDSNGVATGAISSGVEGAQVVTATAGGVAVATEDVNFSTTDIDGDGIPNDDDAFPEDPNRFVEYATVPLVGLGGTFATATAVNASNVVVGLSEDGAGLLMGALWSVSGTTATNAVSLNPIAGNGYSAAYAVDATGAAVGESEKILSVGPPLVSTSVPVVWAAGASTPTELSLGAFSPPATAYGIADGRIVGETATGGGSAAVLWSDAGATPVALASLGGDRSVAYAIAGSFVVGESTVSAGGASIGAVWTLDASGNPGAPVGLAPLPGDVSSIALGVDPAGRIVGESESDTGVVRAVSWTVSAPTEPRLLGAGSAQGVNASGRVAGYGGLPVGPLVWDLRNLAILEGVLTDPNFQLSQAYGLNGANVVVGLLDGGAFAAVPVPVSP